MSWSEVYKHKRGRSNVKRYGILSVVPGHFDFPGIFCSVMSSTISTKIIYDVCSTHSHAGTGASGTGTGTSGPKSELCSTKEKNAERHAGIGTSRTGTTGSGPESESYSTERKNPERWTIPWARVTNMKNKKRPKTESTWKDSLHVDARKMQIEWSKLENSPLRHSTFWIRRIEKRWLRKFVKGI